MLHLKWNYLVRTKSQGWIVWKKEFQIFFGNWKCVGGVEAENAYSCSEYQFKIIYIFSPYCFSAITLKTYDNITCASKLFELKTCEIDLAILLKVFENTTTSNKLYYLAHFSMMNVSLKKSNSKRNLLYHNCLNDHNNSIHREKIE